MDSLITAAARALAAGDALGALNRVALRDDAPALALRGIAMAQLGDLDRAKVLLRRAARAFGPRESVARARCLVAEAEIALVSRDLGWSAKALGIARATLEARGDLANAAHARHLEIRRLLLIGHLDEAERALAELDAASLPPASAAVHELLVAGIAMRRLHTQGARTALARAARAARHAAIPSLAAEVESAALVLSTPAARRLAGGEERLLLLEEVEALLASGALVVDACRHVVRQAGAVVSLARRPVLFALARALGEAWPADVPRSTLVARAFRAKHADESHRARLRVEIGRLRVMLGTLAGVSATKRGFALAPRAAREVVVLARPVEEQHAAVLAFLADGESWSSSALALALGASQRTVQRALELACGGGQGAIVRSGTSAALDDPAGAGVHDDVVILWPVAGRLGTNPNPAASSYLVRLLRRDVVHREPFLAHRIGKALVQRDHPERRGAAFRGNERRGELQRIGCPKRMHAQEPDCVFADNFARFDLVPGAGDLRQPPECKLGTLRVERPVAFKAGQGGSAFDCRSPPCQHVGIALRERLQAPGCFLIDQQRHDRRGVPEFHRPSRRSLISASTPDMPARRRGG